MYDSVQNTVALNSYDRIYIPRLSNLVMVTICGCWINALTLR